MKNKIRIGVLGCANIADRFVIPAILQLKDTFDLVGIASRTDKKAMEFACKFETKPYTGYETLLQTKKIDALYIPLPNSMHYEWIKKALDYNIHVLVEKTMTCSLDETSELCTIAAEKKLALVENFQFRFHRQLQKILSLLKEDEVGEIRLVRSSFGFPPFTDPQNIRYQKELGGGALFDAGAYPVKISQIILGNNLDVKAANLCFDNQYNVDIWGGAYLNNPNTNCFSEIAFGFDNFYQCNLEIWGSKGKLTAERIFTAPPGFSPKLILENSKGKTEFVIPPDNHFQNMLQHFSNLIESKRFDEEYAQNIKQAGLLQQVKERAHAK